MNILIVQMPKYDNVIYVFLRILPCLKIYKKMKYIIRYLQTNKCLVSHSIVLPLT